MYKLVVIKRALFLALAFVVLSAGIVLAESRWVGDVFGTTYHSSGQWKAYTSSSYLKYWLYVNERAWGAPPNPLKDQRWSEHYWAYNSGTVSIWDGYFGYYASRHAFAASSGSSPTYFYTSASGCQSSYCWWSGSSGCGSTC
jgi:hypothetical protein